MAKAGTISVNPSIHKSQNLFNDNLFLGIYRIKQDAIDPSIREAASMRADLRLRYG